MYKKRPVKSLKDILLDRLYTTIYRIIYRKLLVNDVETNTYRMDELQAYVNNVVVPHGQDMLDLVTEATADPNAPWTNSIIYLKFIELFLNKNVIKLKINNCILPSYYDRILEAIVKDEKGSNLQILKIEIKLNDANKNKAAILQIPVNCKKLKSLIIGEASDELLKAISENCNNLSELQLLDSEHNVTDEGIKYLCEGVCRNTLNSFRIIDREHILSSLIYNCPNLTMLPDYHISFDLMRISRVHPYFKSNLTYVTDICPFTVNIDVIIRMCPHLRGIHIVDLNYPLSLMMLTKIENLTTLVLYNTSELVDLMPALRIIGPKLDFLCIRVSDYLNHSIDVGMLAEYCPILTSLVLANVELIYTTINIRIFTKLRDIVLCSVTNNRNEIEIFIKNHSCTDVESISLERFPIQYTDAVIERIFTPNLAQDKFPRLHAINLEAIGNLTGRSIEILMQNCPMLDRLGMLGTWGVSEDFVARLRLRLRSMNSDLIVGW